MRFGRKAALAAAPLLLSGVALAPAAQAQVVPNLVYDVGCSASTLGRGAAVTTTPPTDVRIYVDGAVTGLVPGHRYSYVWPGEPDPDGQAVIGSADTAGTIHASSVPVDLAEPLVDASPKPFELHDETAGDATVYTGKTPFRMRDGYDDCVRLGVLRSGIPNPSGLNVYQLAQQTDGNVVERNGQARALWSTGTAGHPGASAVLQADGNLVTRDSHGRAIWNSGTAGHPRATVTLQTDSNVVVRDQLGHALWSTGIHR